MHFLAENYGHAPAGEPDVVDNDDRDSKAGRRIAATDMSD